MNEYRIKEYLDGSCVIQKKIYWIFWEDCRSEMSSLKYAKDYLAQILEYDREMDERDRAMKKIVSKIHSMKEIFKK